MNHHDPLLEDEALWQSFPSVPVPFNALGSQDDDDVFALVDALDLDDGIPSPPADHEEHGMLEMQPAGVPAPPEPLTAAANDTTRMEKIRARNREAQARYRQKAKGKAAELRAGLAQMQCSIAAARERYRHLQSQRSQVAERCSNSRAALKAMQSVACMLPAAPATAPPALADTASHMAAPSTSASPPVMPTAVASTVHTKNMGVFEASNSAVPPPLTAYRHYRLVSVDQLKEFSRQQDPAAPRLEVNGSSVTAPQLNMRKLVQAFRSYEAMQCGCGVADIAWFATTHVNVVGNSKAGTAGIMSEADSDVRSNVSEMLSFSTTFNSGPCIASFILAFLQLSLENSLTHRAPDPLKGTAPGMSVAGGERDCASEALASINSAPETPGAHHKRRRESPSGPSATLRKPLKCTMEVMASIGLTEDLVDSCGLRCGVGDVVSLRPAVIQVVTDTLKRFSALVPVNVMRGCLERVVQTQDRMLGGLMAGSGASLTDSNTTPPHSHTDTASTVEGSSEAAPQAFKSSGASNSQSNPTSTPASTGEGSSGGVEVRYRQEMGLHTMACMVVTRAEMLRLSDMLPDVLAEATEQEQVKTKAAVLEHNTVLVHDFVFNELVPALDSTKYMFNLIMDSMVPFMGSYFQVDNQHTDLYKVLNLDAVQRARMAEVWMQWENRKRHADTSTKEARALLQALPSHIPLPHEFFSHLNALSASPSRMGVEQLQSAVPPAPPSHFPRFCSSSATSTGTLIHNVDACFMMYYAPPSHPLRSSDHSTPAGAVVAQDPVHLERNGREVSELEGQPGVRFMGQYAADMEAAGRALRALQVVQKKECEVFVDMLSSQMPGVLLCGEQSMRLWADHFVSQVMPPDFVELCQIAATQQNRQNLFKRPFV